jgi:nucleoside diphosphate kinase
MTPVATASRAPTTDVPASAVEALTENADKAVAYSFDPYFRRGIQRITVEAVLPTTFLVFKPDAIAGRRIGTVLDALAENGFSLLDAWPFRFSPTLIRELWRYQYNVATWARIEVVDLLLSSSASMFALVHDTQWEPGRQPAACRLAALKGPADPARRQPGHLRTLLNGPTHLFNFIHTADEPADVVREIAAIEVAETQPILQFDPSLPMPRATLDVIVAGLYARVAGHDLDAEASWQRLASLAGSSVMPLAQSRLSGEAVDWSQLLDLFPNRVPPEELLWDILAIATAEIPHNLPESCPVIATVSSTALREPVAVR